MRGFISGSISIEQILKLKVHQREDGRDLIGTAASWLRAGRGVSPQRYPSNFRSTDKQFLDGRRLDEDSGDELPGGKLTTKWSKRFTIAT
jgi:hypothetical protein